jgi:hypothetical protein
MSDNENNDDGPFESENESENEASVNEDDLIEDNKDFNSDVSESDDETKTTPKKKAVVKKVKKHKDIDDDEEDVEEGEEDDDVDDIEINHELIEEADSLHKKFGIVVDARELDEFTKPNPKMRREIIVDKLKYKSSEYITIYEFCELISVRAQHISDGAYVYVDIEAETTARDIAKKELQLGRCPFLIKRYMTPMNYDPVYIEIWNPNDMAIDAKFFTN